jgi:hypothetical protein
LLDSEFFGSTEIAISRHRGDDIFFKMFEVLHISVHHVYPMLENIGISPLEGAEWRRFKLLVVNMVEGGRVAFTQGPEGRQIPDGFHPNQADAGLSGSLNAAVATILINSRRSKESRFLFIVSPPQQNIFGQPAP